MPLILPANTLDSGFTIDNSIRFDGSSAYLSRTPSSSGNRSTFTISFWTKISGGFGSSSRWIFGGGSGSSDNDYILFPSGDQLKFSFDTESSGNIATSQLFRDPSAWYHVVVAVDTTQSTSSNRVKMYANGNQITSFGTSSYPSQNFTTEINNSGQVQRIGARAYSTTGYFNGYMADFYLIDGQQLAPTEFGETNDNGVWIPKAYDGSFGTNGTHLQFKNSSDLGEATTGNDFTASGLSAVDQTTDTPTNNFNTLNPLANQMGGTLSEGNTKCVAAAAADKHVFGTFGLTKGKWYWEVKATDQGARGSVWVSDSDHNDVIGTNYAGHTFHSGGSVTSGSSNSNVGSGASDNDIICFAVDLDNGQMWISKNEDIDTSGTANITGLATTGLNRDYRISQRETGNPASTFEHNYGNPPFSISSGNSDGAGFGNFEYEVPSGYYALCTKNLAEYG